jgi:hypothetical protein
MESFLGQKEINTMVAGKMNNDLDLEYILIAMEAVMKGRSMMTIVKEKEYFIFLMVIITKVTVILRQY